MLDSDIRYAGSDNESFQAWLQLINRKALAEGCQDTDKRRAAISSLFGKALTWHEEIGINLPQWDDWIESLRGTFEILLTESQWQKLVEERKQLPNETGSAYVLDKVKLCRRRAIPINDAELTPYLIRGLYRPEIRSVQSVRADFPDGKSARNSQRLSRRITPARGDHRDRSPCQSGSLSNPSRQSNHLTRASETSTKTSDVRTSIAGIKNEIQCYNSSCEFGKRASRPVEAGAAINEQKSLKPTNLALIEVHIARVGPVKAMVDTGAMFSVIEKKMIQHLLKEEFLVGGTLLSFNKERVPIVGEIPLTVRFKDRVVDLQKVRVVEQALFPLILGVDWMGESNVGVRPSHQDRCQMEAIIFPETTTNHTDEKLKKEKTGDGNGMLAAITLSPAMPPTRAKRYVMEPCVIPAKTMKFVHVSIEETTSETMMVERAHSAFPNKEWIVPHCLVGVEGKHVRVPVTNLSNEPLMLEKGQKLTRINPWGVDDESENRDEVCGTLGEENTYLPDEIKKKMTNQVKITAEHKVALHKMLDKYAGCFSNEGKIGVDAKHAHRIDTGDARPPMERQRGANQEEGR
ncbi:Histone-lysine N-methyltransferase NSD2-like protein [Daphnia magna]|uniref:Histone-lysine N-methyltransferase NSD2-like protein n=1 Tax=Daphnia magna TaxID=35525 RepID=A0A164L643_9CRUS|nr:Histone-lysine N-methyltransferase NSD2-like protein [Daphnia magna]